MVVLGGSAVSYERVTPVETLGVLYTQGIAVSQDHVQAARSCSGTSLIRHSPRSTRRGSASLKTTSKLSGPSSSCLILSSLELTDTNVYEL